MVVRPTAWPRCYLLPSADAARFEEWILWEVGRRMLVMGISVPVLIAAVWLGLDLTLSFVLVACGLGVSWGLWQGAMLVSFETAFPSAQELEPRSSRFAAAASLDRSALSIYGLVFAAACGGAIYAGSANPATVMMVYLAAASGAPMALRLFSWIEAREWATPDKLRARLAAHTTTATGIAPA